MRRRRFGIISISIILAVLFVLTAVVIAVAQSNEDRMKVIRAMREAQDNPPEYGWLILDGEYIPGPYEVEIKDSAILINGLEAVTRPRKPEGTTGRVYDSASVARQELSKPFLISLMIGSLNTVWTPPAVLPKYSC